MARHAVLRTFCPLDAVIIAVCCIGLIVSVRALPVYSGSDVSIYRDGRLAARYPLHVDRDATIPGAQGNVTIRIQRNSVRVVSADCPEKICIMTGNIRLPAQQIICAPNHILITIGTKEGSCDAVTR
jgi:hypothetical protein